jgi:ABC-type dipeptide/oligopeptide/nickel transport system ATPase component
MGTNQAVDDISFSVQSGKITAIIGESGSGKSVACYSLLGLIPQPPGTHRRRARAVQRPGPAATGHR